MLRRVERVQIQTEAGPVEIPWRLRQMLLGRLRDLEDAGGVVSAFEAVGTSRPVELSDGQKLLVLKVIEADMLDNGSSLPPGIRDLRDALTAELST
jgi:hypothetical protein